MSGSETECVARSDNDHDRKMVAIPKESFLEMEENVKIINKEINTDGRGSIR